MDAKTHAQLNELNRRFYAEVADDFDATRRNPWPGWERMLTHATPPPGRPLQVLDIGCGNGRLIEALDTWGPRPFEYLGIDLSPSLLRHARERYADRTECAFAVGDALDSSAELPRRDPGFDLITLFGVLHHVPGETTRRRLVERLVDRLRPSGVFSVAAWQFAGVERFERRVVAPEDYNRRTEDPIDPAQLEPGDHLLRFAEAKLPRYCHHCDTAELEALFDDLPVRFLDAYASDGKSDDLNRYAVVTRLA